MGEVLKMKAGKIDLDAMRKGINKRTGLNVAHNLSEGSPTIVKEWIPTGSPSEQSLLGVSTGQGIHLNLNFIEFRPTVSKLFSKPGISMPGIHKHKQSKKRQPPPWLT